MLGRFEEVLQKSDKVVLGIELLTVCGAIRPLVLILTILAVDYTEQFTYSAVCHTKLVTSGIGIAKRLSLMLYTGSTGVLGVDLMFCRVGCLSTTFATECFCDTPLPHTPPTQSMIMMVFRLRRRNHGERSPGVVAVLDDFFASEQGSFLLIWSRWMNFFLFCNADSMHGQTGKARQGLPDICPRGLDCMDNNSYYFENVLAKRSGETLVARFECFGRQLVTGSDGYEVKSAVFGVGLLKKVSV